jgi:hypothetical protein
MYRNQGMPWDREQAKRQAKLSPTRTFYVMEAQQSFAIGEVQAVTLKAPRRTKK